MSAILFLLVWILLDIPGVRDTSVSLVLAGGALLGALAFVFQGLLRDFIVGLVILMLLVGCANLAGLQVARSLARRPPSSL